MKSTETESTEIESKRARSPGWLIVWLVPTALLCWFWLCIDFTFNYEGTAKIVTRGGAFWKVLLQYEGHDLDEKGYVVEIEPREEDALLPRRKTFRQRLRQFFGGLRCYGPWPLADILIYKMQWWGVNGKGEVDFHPPEMLDFVLVRPDLYWGEIPEAKDKNLLSLRIDFIITLQVVNPRKALFDIQNYLEAVMERLKAAIWNKVTNSSYEELVVDRQAAAKLIYEGIEDLRKEFIDDYGVKLVSLDIKNIDPPEDYDKQTMAAYIAEQEATRIERLAEARAKEITLVNDAIEKYGDLGITIRALQALEESPLAASVVVQQIPGLKEALKSLGRSEEDLSEKELRDLLGELKNILQEIKEKEE
jgi:hypothetical protein